MQGWALTRFKGEITVSRRQDFTPETLTERERAILGLISEGLSNHEIAAHLLLSLNTVKWYTQQIFSRLDVKRRTQAVAVARSLGLLGESSPTAQLSTGAVLPAPITRLIGREQELADLNSLLDSPDGRLVTISGPGGIGKTRLAQALAEHRQANAGQRVVFVHLEMVTDADQVVPAVAGALGFQFGGMQAPVEQLLTYLRDADLLLILDNFEHLLGAARLVTDMCAVSHRLRVVTTSRVRLDLRGEVVFPLDGLTCPMEVPDWERHSAVQLFLQGARRTAYNTQFASSDMEQIGHICRLVDGLPLAIEIASGWLDVLSPSEIAAEIDRSLTILRSQARDLPERHRSMEAVFENSWRLLTETEQIVFKKLAVFRGGFDRAAAEQVAGASLFVVSTLVDKSLVKRVGADRFALHELLRQFGEMKLSANQAEYQATRENHSHYYADQCYTSEQEMKSSLAAFTTPFLKLADDFDNVVAGWFYAIESPLIRVISKFIYCTSILFHSKGLYILAVQMFSKAQEQYDAHVGHVSSHERLRVLAHLGWHVALSGDSRQGSSLLEAALALTLDREDQSVAQDVCQALFFQALFVYLHGDTTWVKIIAAEALTLAQISRFEFGEIQAMMLLGQCSFVEGKLDTALEYHQAVHHLSQRNHFTLGILHSVAFLGCVYAAQNRHDSAYIVLRQSLTLNRTLLSVNSAFWSLIGIAILQAKLGAPERALATVAIVLHHSHAGLARPEAQVVFDNLRTLIPEGQVRSIMSQAEQGALFTDFLNANFRIDAKFIDHLIDTLDTMQLYPSSSHRE
jgi:predicted ATPase/DNA-binding CsgD family transcriptional regulator